MSGLLDEVSRFLEQSQAQRLVPELCRLLASVTGATTEVWLADYRQQVLRSSTWTGGHGAADADDTADRAQEQPVDGSVVGRCFAGQVPVSQPLAAGDCLALPLSTRGERHGVLELVSAEPLPAGLVSDLEVVATLVGQALSALGTVSGGFERVRRQHALTVAAELQWSLLPGTAYRDADLSVAAMLEPAYSVAGDAFDWTRDEDVLHVAVLEGTGRGVPAALNATLALGALRNARFAGVPLADQAALADQAVYAHHGGGTSVAALLLQVDVVTGRAVVVDAGSPQLYRIRDGRPELVELEAQLPLGMFEETIYTEQELGLRHGDRLVVVSDGVHSTATRAGSFAGSLLAILRDCRLLSAAETARHTLRQLHRDVDDGGPGVDLEDDALVLCLDWHPEPRGAGSGSRGS